jgi:hypothetical protein
MPWVLLKGAEMWVELWVGVLGAAPSNSVKGMAGTTGLEPAASVVTEWEFSTTHNNLQGCWGLPSTSIIRSSRIVIGLDVGLELSKSYFKLRCIRTYLARFSVVTSLAQGSERFKSPL